VSLEPYDVAVPGLSPMNGLSGQPDLGATASFNHESTGFWQTDVSAGVYGEIAWRPAPTVELVPGVRGDYFGSRYQYHPASGGTLVGAQARATIDPRVSARWSPVPELSILSAAGVSHQPSNFPLPSPGLSLSQLSRGLQTAYQYSAGVEVKLPWNLTATADGFLHNYTGLADYFDVCPPPSTTCNFGGRSVGFEFFLRRRLTARITGWLSYTLSRTERDSYYQANVGSGPSGPVIPVRRLSEFDRTHVFNAVFAADLGKRWRVGARFVAYSGLPYASYSASDPPPDSRGPPFFRLDVRIEKTWRALGGEVTFVFEWLNATLQKESLGTNCTTSFAVSGTAKVQAVQHCSPNELPFPITFPSLGIEGAWGGP
jgi:outer membrane receptor protein involved in Fe transport